MTDVDVGWEDYLAGHRMAVDREFGARVEESELNRQQWGLVMTAVEFDVADAADPDRARLVADTSKLEHVAPAMRERSSGGAGSMMAPGGGSAGASGPGGDDAGGGGGGFIDRVKRAVVGGDGDGDDELVGAAERLVDEYVDRLQQRLEDQGQWDEIREIAAERSADGATATDEGSTAAESASDGTAADDDSGENPR